MCVCVCVCVWVCVYVCVGVCVGVCVCGCVGVWVSVCVKCNVTFVISLYQIEYRNLASRLKSYFQRNVMS